MKKIGMLILLAVLVVLLVSGCTQTGEITSSESQERQETLEESTPPCNPNWQCSEWSECAFLDSEQTRTCSDSNNCGTSVDKPIEKQTCKPIGKSMEFDGLKFTIERMQKITKLEYDTWGDQVTVFRVDAKIENNARNKLSVSRSDVKIIDENNNILTAEYGNTLDLSSVLSGATKEGYFLFEIPVGSVKKIEIGEYIYDFEMDKGYTYQQLYDEEYLQNSKNIMETDTWGDFKVTLEKVGFYTLAPRYSWEDAKTYFRADVKVENIGSITTSFNEYDAALVVGSNQYDRAYESTLETSDMRPGIVKEGYILFEDVPKDISGPIRLDTGSAYWKSSDVHRYTSRIYSFDFQYQTGG